MSIPCLLIIWTRLGLYQHIDDLCDLDLGQIDFKINKDHLHSNTNVCSKFKEPRSILCLVIIQTRFGLYIDMLTVIVTLTFEQLTSKSIDIIYTPRHMSAPNLTNPDQFLRSPVGVMHYTFFISIKRNTISIKRITISLNELLFRYNKILLR